MLPVVDLAQPPTVVNEADPLDQMLPLISLLLLIDRDPFGT